MSLEEWISDNSRNLFIAGAGYVAAADFGYITPVWEIAGAGVVATAGVVALAIGYVAAGRLEDLFPDEEGIYIIAFESSDDTGGEIYEISEDQFEAMEVAQGSLFEWPVAKRVYEVKEYRPRENIAVGNWRESVAGSQLAGDCLVGDAMVAIEELRDEFEPEAQRSRYLQRRLKSIARKIDRQRLKDQEEILDPTVTPEFNDDARATVTKIVEESIPQELRPDYDGGSNVEEETETIAFDVLDEMDEPLARND